MIAMNTSNPTPVSPSARRSPRTRIRGLRLVAMIAVVHPAIALSAPVLTARSGGGGTLSVSPGDTFDLDIDLSGLGTELAVSASFDVAFSVGGLQYDSYVWMPPFVTGAGDDLSMPPTSALPAIVSDDLVGAAGSPIDVHFDNFASNGGAGNGTLVGLTLHVPVGFPSPSTVTINVVPGDFVFNDSPFAETPAAGTAFVLNVSAGIVVDVALRVVETPTTPDQGPLPIGLTDACIGGPLFIEIWVSQVDGGTDGLASGSVDLLFDNTLLTADAIDHGSIFVDQATGTINAASGLVDDVGGATPNAGVGVAPDWALLARVNSTAVAAGSAPLSLAAGAVAFSLHAGQGPLDGETQVTLDGTQSVVINAVVQTGDTDCDQDVDLDDFARFDACVTGPPPPGGADPLSVACALVDGDGDGDVDMIDFAIFQANFGVSP